MTKLNSRQKLVLINALKGMNQTEAYDAVYGHDVSSYQRASNLFTNMYFKAELDKHLNGQLAKVEATFLSKEEKRYLLANFARAQLVDLIDEDGQPKLDRKHPSAKALKEWSRRVRIDQGGNPIVTSSMKLVDPITAITEDNKMMGHYAPRKSLIASKVIVELKPYRRLKEGQEDEVTEGD